MQLTEGQLTRLLDGLLATREAGDERRRARRIPIVTRGTLRVLDGAPARTFSVLTRDISATGVGLIAAAPIERGVRIALTLQEGSAAPTTLTCDVRYCRAMADGIWGVGVEFVDVADARSGSACQQGG